LLLQLFVGVVDAELLEGVDLERLKAVYVQHPDEASTALVVMAYLAQEREQEREGIPTCNVRARAL